MGGKEKSENIPNELQPQYILQGLLCVLKQDLTEARSDNEDAAKSLEKAIDQLNIIDNKLSIQDFDSIIGTLFTLRDDQGNPIFTEEILKRGISQNPDNKYIKIWNKSQSQKESQAGGGGAAAAHNINEDEDSDAPMTPVLPPEPRPITIPPPHVVEHPEDKSTEIPTNSLTEDEKKFLTSLLNELKQRPTDSKILGGRDPSSLDKDSRNKACELINNSLTGEANFNDTMDQLFNLKNKKSQLVLTQNMLNGAMDITIEISNRYNDLWTNFHTKQQKLSNQVQAGGGAKAQVVNEPEPPVDTSTSQAPTDDPIDKAIIECMLRCNEYIKHLGNNSLDSKDKYNEVIKINLRLQTIANHHSKEDKIHYLEQFKTELTNDQTLKERLGKHRHPFWKFIQELLEKIGCAMRPTTKGSTFFSEVVNTLDKSSLAHDASQNQDSDDNQKPQP